MSNEATLVPDDATTRADALKLACERAGGQNKLAKRIGTTQGQIWYWLTKSKHGVSPRFVLPIERETGVSRSTLRPDLFPRSAVAEARP